MVTRITDQDALEKLLAAIVELFPRGPKRERMLAWLDEVSASVRESKQGTREHSSAIACRGSYRLQ